MQVALLHVYFLYRIECKGEDNMYRFVHFLVFLLQKIQTPLLLKYSCSDSRKYMSLLIYISAIESRLLILSDCQRAKIIWHWRNKLHTVHCHPLSCRMIRMVHLWNGELRIHGVKTMATKVSLIPGNWGLLHSLHLWVENCSCVEDFSWLGPIG